MISKFQFVFCLFLSFFFFFQNCNSQIPELPHLELPHLKFDKKITHWNFDEQEVGDSTMIKRHLYFKNISDYPIQIISSKSSDGGFFASHTKKNILPNERNALNCHFSISSLKLKGGILNKSIRVFYNLKTPDSTYHNLTEVVKVKGELEPAFFPLKLLDTKVKYMELGKDESKYKITSIQEFCNADSIVPKVFFIFSLKNISEKEIKIKSGKSGTGPTTWPKEWIQPGEEFDIILLNSIHINHWRISRRTNIYFEFDGKDLIMPLNVKTR